jgi:hypothetical protein
MTQHDGCQQGIWWHLAIRTSTWSDLVRDAPQPLVQCGHGMSSFTAQRPLIHAKSRTCTMRSSSPRHCAQCHDRSHGLSSKLKTCHIRPSCISSPATLADISSSQTCRRVSFVPVAASALPLMPSVRSTCTTLACSRDEHLLETAGRNIVHPHLKAQVAGMPAMLSYPRHTT